MSTIWIEETNPRPRLARITVDQYDAMVEKGLLPEGPIELIDGLLVHKNRAARGQDPMTVGDAHAATVDNLAVLAASFRKLGSTLRIQNPIRLPPGNEPEPDAAVVGPRQRGRHPGPDHVYSVIEASDSSLEYDRKTKEAIYASAGIPQYVIVNLVDELVEVHTRPRAGRYSQREILPRGKSLRISAGSKKSVTVRVNAILP